KIGRHGILRVHRRSAWAVPLASLTVALCAVFQVNRFAACQRRQLFRIGNDIIGGEQFLLRAIGKLRHSFWVGFVFDLIGEKFETRFNAGLIGPVGLLELLDEFQGPLGKFLHLRELILVYSFPVLDGVFFICPR